jgi:hypothetical protein
VTSSLTAPNVIPVDDIQSICNDAVSTTPRMLSVKLEPQTSADLSHHYGHRMGNHSVKQ